MSSVRLRAVASSIRELLSGRELPHVALEHVESGTGGLLPGVELESKAAGAEILFRRGDVLFGKLRPYLAKVLAPDFDGCASGEFLVLRPNSSLEPRYLHYVCLSRPFIEWTEATSVGTKMPRTDWETISAFRLEMPSLDGQRGIAQFLDRETARIDSLIGQRRNLLALLGQRESQLFEHALGARGAIPGQTLNLDSWHLPAGWSIVRLSKLLGQLTNGYVGPTRDILQEKGIHYIQSVHIKDGEIDFARRPYFVDQPWHVEHSRTALRPGDLLIVQTGDVGQVALVPGDFGEANCHALLIARVRPERVRPEYLYEYFRSHFGFESLLRETTGALHPHLEAGKVRDIGVVVPPLSLQDELVDEVEERRAKSRLLRSGIESQLGLLTERRQALITAAVTGLKLVGRSAA